MTSLRVRRYFALGFALVLLSACGGGDDETPSDQDVLEPPAEATDVQPGEEVSTDPSDPGETSDPADPDDPSDPRDPPELPPEVSPEDPACPTEGPLVNQVRASSWVSARTAIDGYRYTADVTDEGVATLSILGSLGDRLLGTVSVRQLLGDEDNDGAMQADFVGPQGAEFRLLTRGEDLSPQGYTQRAWLEDRTTGARIEMEARFETVRCWSAEDGEAGPPCAGALPLLDASVPFLGCGLITDDRIHAGAPAELTQLVWLVETEGELAAGGDTVRRGDKVLSRLEVFGNGAVVDASERSAWLEDHGAAWLESTAVTNFLAMWSDRAWWRTLEHHVAYCEVTLLDEPSILIPKSRCPGDHQADRWGSPANGRTAGVFGDPNLVTLDGHGWAFHGTGEYVLVESREGPPFAVHARFEPVLDVPIPACLGVSLSTGIATQIDGHRVTVLRGPPFAVWVDDVLVESADALPVLGDGYEIQLRSGRVELRWPGGEVVTAQDGAELLTITVTLPPERRGAVRGLLGTFDGRPATDHALPNGTVLPQPLSFEAMYNQLGPAWRLDAESTLFRHGAGEGPDDFFLPGFPENSVRVADLPADRVASAAEVCDAEGIRDAHLRSACILDVVCMESPEVAQSTAQAPLPLTSQPPGFHDLVVVGDVRQVEPPSVLDLDEEMSLETCRPWRPETLSLFAEEAAVELDEALDVALASPGTLRLGQEAGGTLEAGHRVQSWSLSRRAPVRAARVHNAEIRFAQPIVGVIVEAPSLVDTDAFLGTSSTAYPGVGPAALAADEDRIVVDADRRTLRVTWTGSEPHRMRILVEAP